MLRCACVFGPIRFKLYLLSIFVPILRSHLVLGRGSVEETRLLSEELFSDLRVKGLVTNDD